MTAWQRWLQAPNTLWLRRMLFQVHLWLGIGFGVYILMLSLSGSAVVLRPQFSRWFVHNEAASSQEPRLEGGQLEAKIAAAYADFTVKRVVPSTRGRRATYVALEQDGVESTRYFDPYSGLDLGPTFPWPVASMEWLVSLHDDLLLGPYGKTVNGFGGALLLGMLVTGVILWWQGKRRWQEGLVISAKSPRSFMWQLHSFVGFWAIFLLFVWGVTAVYFAWPEPFDAVIDWMDENPADGDRPDAWLLFLIRMHFGRFRDALWANILWMLLGLLPALLYVSGFLLWYRRVLKKLPEKL
ncbi:MAG: PepSY-associated TM helix domain-containing protein [Gammaproteobacteria bacterium]|jgi:hypothetical protein